MLGHAIFGFSAASALNDSPANIASADSLTQLLFIKLIQPGYSYIIRTAQYLAVFILKTGGQFGFTGIEVDRKRSDLIFRLRINHLIIIGNLELCFGNRQSAVSPSFGLHILAIMIGLVGFGRQ